MNQEKTLQRSKFVWLAVALAVFALIVVGLNVRAVQDWLRGLGYTPTAQVAKIQSELDLTGDAERIFMATRPVLEEQTAFNQHCASYDAGISVLGCYSGGQVYVYEIDNAELAGIMESTMAHELLHAVWSRMPSDEKADLGVKLAQVYNEHSGLIDELEVYDVEDQMDELHSRVGTQIANLPDELEVHYAKYFVNQDAVVRYYDAYNGKFEQLKNEMEVLSDELKKLSDEIDIKTQDYTERMDKLTSAINEFNKCAETMGCFKTVSEFNQRRSELVKEQATLKGLYEEIDRLVNQHNQKVEIYNGNVLKSQTLQNSINSNSAPPTI